jgi:hypothetical protein
MLKIFTDTSSGSPVDVQCCTIGRSLGSRRHITNLTERSVNVADLTICITVDWEGEDLQERNLQAMADFRASLPGIPITHFICPAYFTRGDGEMESNEDRVGKIKNQIKDGLDEVGLHVHAWQSLTRAAGVVPRDGMSSTLNGYGFRINYPAPPFTERFPPDTGHGVPLGVYSIDELTAILQFSRDLLLHYRLTESVESFRCGGWMASSSVLQALHKVGLRYDSSATDAAFFATEQVSPA